MTEPLGESRQLQTVGIDAPLDFPVVPYHEIFFVVRRRSTEEAVWDEFAGAWNAVAHRFVALVHYADAFRNSITTHGSIPKSPIRSEQERILFGFFTNAVSCLEATCYGLFAVGAFVAPQIFRLETSEDRRNVTPASTSKAYARAFPQQPIVEALRIMREDKAFEQLQEIRNVLAHRSHPGRRTYVSFGEAPEQPTEWKLGSLALTPDILIKRRADVARLLGDLLKAFAPFLSGRF